MKEWIDELWEEFSDFVEDIWEHLTENKSQIEVKEYDTVNAIRPAYVFAERIDNALRLVFGFSVIISALTATFLGYSSLSELVHMLITTIWGRLLMGLIGFSYITISYWKLFHLKQVKKIKQ